MRFIRAILRKHIQMKREGGYFLLLKLKSLRVLRRLFYFKEMSKDTSVAVLIPIKDRELYRLINCLTSLKHQSYPSKLISITIIDYNSEATCSKNIKKISEEFKTAYIHVPNVETWSRSHCLNVGIRKSLTKYILISDVDLIFSNSYIEECVSKLKKYPMSLLVSKMLDLPESSENRVRGYAEKRKLPDINQLAVNSTTRFNDPYHASIIFTQTKWLKKIKGYDEYYKLWGFEDIDMFNRLLKLGLKVENLSPSSFYLHQWHKKYLGVISKNLEFILDKNKKYYDSVYTIKRNGPDWGKI